MTRAQSIYVIMPNPAYAPEKQRIADAYQHFCDMLRMTNEALSEYDRLTGVVSDNVSPLEFIELARGGK